VIYQGESVLVRRLFPRICEGQEVPLSSPFPLEIAVVADAANLFFSFHSFIKVYI
jgi:hypothetical protein